MGRSTPRGGIRGAAQNAIALAIAGAGLYAALWIGQPLALFGIVTVGVFAAGNGLTYLVLRMLANGWALKALAFLAALLWLAAGVMVADAAYDTPVRCGPGLGAQPFREVAGSFETGLNGRARRPCLPAAAAVLQTLQSSISGAARD